jgi:type IV pilus assembly protein PilO
MNDLIEKFAKVPVKQKIALLVVLWGMMGALYYFLVYTDQDEQKVSLEGQLQKINTEKTKLRLIAEEKIKYEKRLQELEDKRKKALALLPDEPQLEELTIDLNRRAKQAQIRIAKITPLPEVPMGFYARVPVELVLEGTFHQLVVFFNHVSEMKRIVNIQDVFFQNPVRREGQMYLQTKVLATSYRSLKEAVAAKSAAPGAAAPKPGLVQRGKQAIKKGSKRAGRRRIEE